MDTGQAFLLLETTATIFMAGVLWTMQLLNYPLLALVGTEAFPVTRPRTNAASRWWSSRGLWPRPPQVSASCCPGPARCRCGRRPAR
jgi:hypothetical protein